MKYYTDIHIHSRYSRATSKELDLEHLSLWAQLKGLHVVGTGDCIHPQWLDTLEQKLQPAESGLFALCAEHDSLAKQEVPPACKSAVRFMLSTEISNIYKRGEKVRKVHNLVCLPSVAAARALQSRLDAIGNIASDGRPILGLDSRDLLEIVLECDERAYLIPAHIWTPWFSVLGSKSGFDTVEECYGDLSSHITAVETGLSSDPPMNWRIRSLDPYVLVSNSDAHSPAKLGRESTIFDTELSYDGMIRALTDRGDQGLVGTIEFFPQEGKYHLDGHRKCTMRMEPAETIAHGGRCPACGGLVTVGVMARVASLADRPPGAMPPNGRPFRNLIPLPELVAEAEDCGAATKRVRGICAALFERVGNELHVLQDAPIEDIARAAGPVVAEGVRRMRKGEVSIAAGYDGEFGSVKLFSGSERRALGGQTTLLTAEDIKNMGARPKKARERPDAPALPPLGEALDMFETAAYPSVSAAGESRDIPAVAETSSRANTADLNEAQRQAAEHQHGHLLIVAGPGTGKTHTLTRRVARISESLGEEAKALALTFTNKAAEEMADRLQRYAPDSSHRVFVGTFHRFCLSLLRDHTREAGLPPDFLIASVEQVDSLSRQVWPDQSASKRREFLQRISSWKSSATHGDESPEATAYNRLLRENGLLDFDDLQLEALRLLGRDPHVARELHRTYRYVFVDEYQDIDDLQQSLLEMLVADSGTLTAIGDPNQSIYGFRGASSAVFERFEHAFPGATTIHLTRNYRAARSLLTASGQVIEAGKAYDMPRLSAELALQGRLSIHEAPTEKAEAEHIVHEVEKMVGGTTMFSHDSGRVDYHDNAHRSFGDIAVLYRTNSQSRPLIEAFRRSGIPYQVSGATPLREHPFALNVASTLRFAKGFSLPLETLVSVLGFTVEGVGARTAEQIVNGMARGVYTSASLSGLSHYNSTASSLSHTVRGALGRFAAHVEALGRELARQGVPGALDFLSETQPWQDTAGEHADVWRQMRRGAQQFPELGDFLDYLFLQRADDAFDKTVERVCLMTLHAAKGLEFPVVFVAGCEEGLIPLSLEGRASDPGEERRLFYVGMTRAKERLCLVRARKRTLFGKTEARRPSPFLRDIDEELKRYDNGSLRPRKAPRSEAEQLNLF